MVPSVLRKRSSSCTTWRPASSSRSIRISRGRWRLARPAASSRPSGEFCSSAAITLSLTWLASTSCQTRCGRSRGSTRWSCSVHSRSRMIAAATIEHRMIGHISGPPACTISHIRSDPDDRLTAKARIIPKGPPAQGNCVPCARTHPRRGTGSARVRDSCPAGSCKRSPRTPRAAGPVAAATVRRAPDGSAAVVAAPARRHAAFGVGLAICFMPLPVHLAGACALALLWRLNVPVICGTTFLVNPLTMVPIYYWPTGWARRSCAVPRHHFDFRPAGTGSSTASARCGSRS